MKQKNETTTLENLLTAIDTNLLVPTEATISTRRERTYNREPRPLDVQELLNQLQDLHKLPLFKDVLELQYTFDGSETYNFEIDTKKYEIGERINVTFQAQAKKLAIKRALQRNED